MNKGNVIWRYCVLGVAIASLVLCFKAHRQGQMIGLMVMGVVALVSTAYLYWEVSAGDSKKVRRYDKSGRNTRYDNYQKKGDGLRDGNEKVHVNINIEIADNVPVKSGNMIEQILAFNRGFVERKNYEKYLTSKYPDKKLAVLSCMDTRLTELLPAALGLKNGDAKIIKNAGGLVISAFDSAMRSLIVAIYELGVEEIMVVAHSHCGACHMSFDHFHHEMKARGVTEATLSTIQQCGIDLHHWLEGFKDTPESVRKTVETIKTHPLVPRDIVVRGFIIDSETGALEEITD